MNNRGVLDTVCPNNHNLTVAFDRADFEKALETDSLVLHCNTCDANWPPSKEEIAQLRKQLSHRSDA